MFVVHPIPQAANVGQNVSFSALATGEGAISYQWMKDSAALQGETGTALNLSAVVAADAGSYRCEGTNVGGTASSNAAALAVFDPPRPNGAAFIGSSAPAQMFSGQDLLIGVTMRDTSELSWSSAQGYALGVIDDPANLFLGATRIYFSDPAAVVPALNGIAQFVGAIQAPAAPGVYLAQLGMVEENVEFFGETATLTISVVPRPNTAVDWMDYE